MDYTYLVLLVPGFLLCTGGFVLLGRKVHPLLAGLAFLAGTVGVVLGVLLTCVPDFFSA